MPLKKLTTIEKSRSPGAGHGTGNKGAGTGPGHQPVRRNRVTKGGDGDGGGERDVVVGIDSDSELPGIKYAFPRPTRSSWRPPIQLTKGDEPHSDHNTESGFAT